VVLNTKRLKLAAGISNNIDNMAVKRETRGPWDVWGEDNTSGAPAILNHLCQVTVGS